jgi:hypothetical protein
MGDQQPLLQCLTTFRAISYHVQTANEIIFIISPRSPVDEYPGTGNAV